MMVLGRQRAALKFQVQINPLAFGHAGKKTLVMIDAGLKRHGNTLRFRLPPW